MSTTLPRTPTSRRTEKRASLRIVRGILIGLALGAVIWVGLGALVIWAVIGVDWNE